MNLLHDPAQVIGFLTFSAVAAGMGAMLFVVAVGLGRPLLGHPLALQALKWVGAREAPGKRSCRRTFDLDRAGSMDL
jgi:hypothetical protein